MRKRMSPWDAQPIGRHQPTGGASKLPCCPDDQGSAGEQHWIQSKPSQIWGRGSRLHTEAATQDGWRKRKSDSICSASPWSGLIVGPRVGLARFVLVYALIVGLISLGVPNSARGAVPEESAHPAPPVAIVDRVAEITLLPIAQVAVQPDRRYSIIIEVQSLDMPTPWVAVPTEVSLETIDPSATGILRVEVTVNIVAVAFADEAGSNLRYGFGLTSDVFLGVQGQGLARHHGSAFELISETATPEAAVARAHELQARLAATNPPAPGTAPSYYSNCVSMCLGNAHAQFWGLFMSCLGVAGTVEAVIAGSCALGCILTGPGWVACVTSCLGTIGLALQIPIAVLLGACLATYLAAMTVAVGVCTIGCLW